MPTESKSKSGAGKTSAAQIKAMNEYRKRRGGAAAIQRGFSTTYSRQEGDRIAAALAAAGLTPAQILRAVAAWIEQGTHPAAVAGIAEDAAEFAALNAAIRAEHTEHTDPAPQSPADPDTETPAPADAPPTD